MTQADPATYDAESILQTIREPLVVLAPDLRVLTVNHAFARMFRIHPEAAVGRLIYELDEGAWDIPQLRRLLEDVLPSQSTFDGFEVDHDFKPIGRRILLLNARRVRKRESAAESILLAMEDVTERRRLENERREVETRFTSLVKNVRDHAIFTLDLQGRITSWNLAAQRILGFTEEEVLGRDFAMIFTPEDQTADIPAWEMQVAVSEGQAEDERWHVRRDGEHFWALGIVTPTFDEHDSQTGYSKILRDMTDRKRAEQRAEQLNQELSRLNDELQTRVDERTRDLEVSMKRLSVEEELSRQRADRLRELAGELTSSENKQRRELARLLHDHVQQLLVAAKQRIELAVDDVSDSARVGLKEALGILDQSITATRSLSVELDPPLLQEEGLVVALRWLAERMQRQHGLVIDLDLDENANPRVEAHRAILFQVAQELLLNVIKHSGTKQATLLLATRGQQNWLVVRDAGRGFDAELEGSNTGSYGLPHLRRRLESVGGCLVVESTPGGGTYAAATVPCPVLAAESQRRS